MYPHDFADSQPDSVADAVTAMKLERPSSADGRTTVNGRPVKDEPTDNGLDSVPNRRSTTATLSVNDMPLSAIKSRSPSSSPVKPAGDLDATEEKIRGDVTVKLEPGQPPKLARSSSQKVVARPPQLFLDLPDSTEEARSSFETLEVCTYANKYMGYTEHAMECDCAEEWDPAQSKNHACGEDSDCINRATKIECVGDCGCGPECQNQRFQRKEYAKVAVIKTEKKGYGLRAETDLRPHQFIYEYVGEVINEAQFRRRMRQYDEEGIKHFYFMSLNKGEFVDATKKGNLGRFCNHSCNPNCYVDKWVVGEKLRMGIFTERSIKAGEELVFNYNVDRYGADPQPCYCGEPNCTGFIGGRTQTERATKLSNATIEALGIDDAESWDTVVAKRPRKKKMGEDDEEYVDSVQPKSLGEDGVTKVMAALMQCKEKWIAVKLLGRIQRCEDERVRNRVVKMHGYQILNSQLSMWKEDSNVVLQVFDILEKFPRLTRNKIIDSKIENTIQPLTSCGDERVEKRAASLMEVWATLEVGYRIPRMKRDRTTAASTKAFNQFERRETTGDDRKISRSRSRSRSRSLEAPRGPAAQTRGGHGQRNNYHHGPRPFRRPFNPLPPGWFAAESNGRTYYYSSRGDTTWTKPTAPAPQPPPPPKPESRDKALQDIIDGIMNAKENTPKEQTNTPGTPQVLSAHTPDKAGKKDKWKTYSEEKQKKIYENTLFPHIKYVVDKFKHKLPKDELKRHAKEIAKKLVNSDFKNNRVEDPTVVSEKQQKKVKKFCKEYFDKAVVKHREHEKKKAAKKAKENGEKETPETHQTEKDDESDNEALDVKMSDDEAGKEESRSSPMDAGEPGAGLKRKREELKLDGEAVDECDSPSKRQRSSTPPPPPPPPMSPSGEKKGVEEAVTTSKSEESVSSGGNQTWDIPSPAPPPPPPPPPPERQNDSSIRAEVETDLSSGPNGLQGQIDTDQFSSHPAEGKLQPSQLGIEGKV
ncbi:histone methyltransferase set2 [Monascus purpureus]|uniref:Histone-lysine N-methyltransferase, H3 lysine-36 specific n=1 Tax=Monascus purpureus TaxID=5098 RepID=A0A507QZE0_MONPU|nr:histone methyltransferase set2 [Monascus purpureus]BDD61998.1 histone methyltransferase set2 [Monascus purpureus]